MIITKIFECDNRIIQKQFTRCISTIARLDYPEKWPTLLSNDILSYLNSQNEKGIYTGLLALHALVQKYEFCLEEEREPLLLVIDQSFGVLGGLINHLMAHTESDVALQILHMICKVFFSFLNWRGEYCSLDRLLQPATEPPNFFKFVHSCWRYGWNQPKRQKYLMEN